MKNNVDFPEFKDCACGARMRLQYVENPHFAKVYIAFAACGCGESYFSLVGDGVDVTAAAEDLEGFLASRGQTVTNREFGNLRRH